MTDDERIIRKALQAGPTPGPWTPMPAGAGEQCVARVNHTEAVPPKGVELAHESVDARYIAACSPDRIERLLDEVERLRAFERGVIEAIPGPRYMDPPDGGDVTPLEQVRRMAEEVELLLSANQNLQGWLYGSGFVPCDIAACNCGGWHARFGLPERMNEFKEALSAAGHPLTNENGNLPLRALAELIGERDTLRAELAEAKRDADRYRWLKDKAFRRYRRGEGSEMKERRIGKVIIRGVFFDDALDTGHGANLFTGSVLLETRRSVVEDIIEVFMWCKDFDIVPPGQVIPEYRAVFEDDSAVPRWERVGQ